MPNICLTYFFAELNAYKLPVAEAVSSNNFSIFELFSMEQLFVIISGLFVASVIIILIWSKKKIKKLNEIIAHKNQLIEEERSIKSEKELDLASVQRRTGNELAKAQKAAEIAEQANRAKSTFLATMSHEVRTPLNCILGLAEVLMTTDPNEEQKDYLDSIRSSVNALLGIIGNVLDFSKIESGNLDLRPERFNMNTLLEEIHKLFAVGAHQKGIQLRCEMESELPLHVMCDRNHLRQVLINLVGNAVKFTEEGEVVLTIGRERIPQTDSPNPGKVFYKVKIKVSDTGIGIQENQRDELFKPFSQLVSSKTRKYEGTGLGLAICKKIIDTMEGTIHIDSNQPQGSIFHVELVLEGFSVKTATRPPIDALSQSNLVKHALGSSFYSHRVLVADDNPLNCKVMKAMMEKMGHKAEFVTNGNQAVEYLRNHPIDIVFMDIMMPVCDGMEATKKIRNGEAGEANKEIPIVALTAFALTSDREKFLSCGMDFYLSKPVEPELLRQLLTTLARQNSKNPHKKDN